jgi:spermidine synthase
VILFVTGFASMAMEVVWTRAFTPVMKTTIYAFAALLVTYLVATWLGSVAYRKSARRGTTMPVGQLMAYLAASTFLPIVMNDPRIPPNSLTVCISIAPLCGLLGYLTPSLIDATSAGHPQHAGKVYAVNILGCILGPLVAGYAMLPTIGVKGSLIILGLPLLILSLITFKSWTTDVLQRNTVVAMAVVLLALSVSVVKTMEDKDLYKNAVVRRDHTATVISEGEGWTRRLLVNGIGITNLNPVCKTMAHLPAGHLPRKPENILVICFGMGTTFRSAMSWGTDVTAVELVPSVRDAFGFYFDDAETLLKNPRAHVVIDDGRRFLKRTSQKFDVITIDPPPPVEAAGSSLLYSEQFYEDIRARLSDDGILQQWYPSDGTPDNNLIAFAVARSIINSFPHVRVFGTPGVKGLHFLASMKPIPRRTAEEVVARLPTAAQADLVEWYQGLDALGVVRGILNEEYTLDQFRNQAESIFVSDDRPFNEYYLLRRYFGYEPGTVAAPSVVVVLVCALIVCLIAFRPRRAPTPTPGDPSTGGAK